MRRLTLTTLARSEIDFARLDAGLADLSNDLHACAADCEAAAQAAAEIRSVRRRPRRRPGWWPATPPRRSTRSNRSTRPCCRFEEKAMTDGEKLLWAILLDPFDHVAMLAYADWMEEVSRGLAGRHETPAGVRKQVADELAGLGVRRCGEHVSVSSLIRHIESRPDEFAALAAGIFRRHPVVSVRLIGTAPARHPQYAPGGWSWECRHAPFYPPDQIKACHLPPGVFYRLAGGRELSAKVEGVSAARIYLSEADAVEDASAACVYIGRRMAGLPPLRR